MHGTDYIVIKQNTSSSNYSVKKKKSEHGMFQHDSVHS